MRTVGRNNFQDTNKGKNSTDFTATSVVEPFDGKLILERVIHHMASTKKDYHDRKMTELRTPDYNFDRVHNYELMDLVLRRAIDEMSSLQERIY